jgi:hypothetical protein
MIVAASTTIPAMITNTSNRGRATTATFKIDFLGRYYAST